MSTQSENAAPAKRRWYQNLKDSFTVVKRSFPWAPWAILGTTAAAVAVCLVIAAVTSSWISYSIMALMMVILVPLIWLSALIRKAMYRQIEHLKGCVGAAIRDIRRGWVATEEPVAFNRDQDMVWRLVGPPGVVLISEGPHHRAQKLLTEEKQKTARVVATVPVHTVECGLEEGQQRLEDVMRTIYKLPKAVSRAEIPQVTSRLRAIQAKTGMPIPKGIDPLRMRPDRRAMR